jgi:thioesterase domain-containing protein
MIAQPIHASVNGANGIAKSRADDVFVFPVTAAQRGFWVLDQQQPGNPAYNIAVRFRLQGVLRVKEFERAFNEIVRRHEALRTVVAVVRGVPVQVVSPQLSILLGQDNLRGGPEKHRRERAEVVAAEEARLGFDLARGPLIRARVLRLDDEEHHLLVTVHHIVADGWSIGVLIKELGALYDAYCHGLESPLPDLAVQLGDVAVWQQQWLQSKDWGDQVAYWIRQLAKMPRLEIAPDRPRPAAQTFQGNIESTLVSRELTDGLMSLANREEVTPFMVMLAAFQLLLQRYSGQNDIFVGSVIAARPLVELEPLIGPLINPLVLRTDLSGDPPLLELLARVRETVLQAFANKDVPFDRVVEAMQLKRDPRYHPLFQINFLYQRDFIRPFHVSGLTLTPIPSLSPGVIYDLNFFLVERAEGWRASCEYNTELYELSTIRFFLRDFQRLLEEIVANPACRISEVASRTAASKMVAPHTSQPTGQTLLPSTSESSTDVAPRDPVESQLTELWERLLGVKGLGATADFFEVGGHSLMAAKLLVEVEKAFEKKLSFASFLQSPTIASLAARIRGETKASDQLHAIQAKGSRPPWIVVTSQPHIYRTISRHLGPNQPLLGLTAPELAALPEGFTMKDLAANLIKTLRTSVPHGPYYLGGWCVSGIIAYEMAQQLGEQGENVALLVLLDTNCPVYLRKFQTLRTYPIRLYFSLRKIARHFKIMRKLPLSKWLPYLWQGISTRWKYWRDKISSFAGLRRGLSPEERFNRVHELAEIAALHYDPEPIRVPVLLFRSEALQTGWFCDPVLGWAPFALGGLTLCELPGDHNHLFLEPAASQLATVLAASLERCRMSPLGGFDSHSSPRVARPH